MTNQSERRRLLDEIRRVNQQLASDASAARQRTLEALRASARITRADSPGHAKHFSPSSAGRAIRFPKPAPRTYRRAGVSYQRSAIANPDGTLRTTFHMRMTNCDNAATAAAHQAYIDREQAVTFSIGNIANTTAERQDFWTSLGPAMRNQPGSITIPADLPPEARQAIAECLLNADPPLSAPPNNVIHAWCRRPRKSFRIGSLEREQFDSICNAIHQTWTDRIQPDHTPSPGKPHVLPAGIHARRPRRATVQRRFILELPHDVTEAAREAILTRWLQTNLDQHNAIYHAVIHRPPKGNDTRNWHAHIAICHYDVARKPGSNYPDPNAIRKPLRVNKFSAILSRNAPGLSLPERNELARQTFRDLRNSFAATANEELRTSASIRRYDPRSYRDQGLAITPGQHRGTDATALQKRGIPTRWNDHARDWLNAAHAASKDMSQTDADNIVDAVENEMVTASLDPDSHALRDTLEEQRPALDPYLSTANDIIDGIASQPFQDPLSAPLAPWIKSWTNVSTSPETSALQTARFASNLVDAHPEITSIASRDNHPQHAPASKIAAAANAFSETRNAWSPAIETFLQSRSMPEQEAPPNQPPLQLHHRIALSITTAAADAGCTDIAPICDAESANAIARSANEAQEILNTHRRQQDLIQEQLEHRRRKLRAAWKQACNTGDRANFIIGNRQEINELLPAEEAQAMRRTATAKALSSQAIESVNSITRHLVRTPPDSAANHILLDTDPPLLDALLAQDPDRWHDCTNRIHQVRYHRDHWDLVRPALSSMSDEEFLSIDYTTLEHARHHDPRGHRTATNRASRIVEQIAQEFDDSLDLPPQEAAWHITRTYTPFRNILRNVSPELHKRLAAYHSLAQKADAILLENARSHSDRDTPPPQSHLNRLREIDPVLAAQTIRRYDPSLALKPLARAPSSIPRTQVPAP